MREEIRFVRTRNGSGLAQSCELCANPIDKKGDCVRWDEEISEFRGEDKVHWRHPRCHIKQSELEKQE